MAVGVTAGRLAEAEQRAMDDTAFQMFYRKTARPLWAYLYRAAGNAADADDLLQDVFCRFLQSAPPTADESQLRAYLFTVAGTRLVDHWRRRGRERRALDRASEESEPEAPPPDSTAHDLARLFGHLKPKERALLWLAYVERAGHREIAAALGLKERSVRVLLFRARKRLVDLVTRAGLV